MWYFGLSNMLMSLLSSLSRFHNVVEDPTTAQQDTSIRCTQARLAATCLTIAIAHVSIAIMCGMAVLICGTIADVLHIPCRIQDIIHLHVNVYF